MEGDLYYTGGVWLHETISEGWDKRGAGWWGGGLMEQGDERRKKRKDESDSGDICSVSEQTCRWRALARHPSSPLGLTPAWCLSTTVALIEQLNHTHACTHTYTQTLFNQLAGWPNEVWEQLKTGGPSWGLYSTMSFVLQSFSYIQVSIFLFTKSICTGMLVVWQFIMGYGLVASSSLKMHCFLSIYLRGSAVLTCIIGTQVLLSCCWPSSWVPLPTQSKLIGCPSVTWKPVSSIS